MKKESGVIRSIAVAALVFTLMVGVLISESLLMGTATVSAESAPADADGDGGDDADDANEAPDVPITGTALELASAAALDYIGEGRVTDTEVGDEEGYYEVEIRRDNGREVDVHLDEAFNILGHEDD